MGLLEHKKLAIPLATSVARHLPVEGSRRHRVGTHRSELALGSLFICVRLYTKCDDRLSQGGGGNKLTARCRGFILTEERRV
jgi:hypothetical protein